MNISLFILRPDTVHLSACLSIYLSADFEFGNVLLQVCLSHLVYFPTVEAQITQVMISVYEQSLGSFHEKLD